METAVRTERFQFPGSDGQMLSAALDLPEQPPAAFALLAHCFTCGKDVLAAKRISDGLVARGIAVLRFDFTGLGSSEGEFANTHFSSNVADLVCAAGHLRKHYQAPALLIGHSLGGAAVLAAASQVPEAKAVVTIAAPFDPAHVIGLISSDEVTRITQDGSAEVSLAGRPFTIKREFLDDVKAHRLKDHIHHLHKALLIFHSPTDDTVGIENATEIFIAARHPKSFVSLTGATHLLNDRNDALYVADMIAAWSTRYLDPAPSPEPAQHDPDVVVQETRESRFQQTITAGTHTFLADEPVAVGGMDSGPGPYDFLLAGLGACTSMTMRLYAERKALPLDRTTVRLRHSRIYATDCEECETRDGMISRIEREITMDGDLTEEQRGKLMEIADKCPVHRTLTSEIQIVTRAT